jgi:hypothetical protein
LAAANLAGVHSNMVARRDPIDPFTYPRDNGADLMSECARQSDVCRMRVIPIVQIASTNSTRNNVKENLAMTGFIQLHLDEFDFFCCS